MNIRQVTVAEDFPLKTGEVLIIRDGSEKFAVRIDAPIPAGKGKHAFHASTRRMFKPRKLTKWGPKPRKV
jgi:hypothetical protein